MTGKEETPLLQEQLNTFYEQFKDSPPFQATKQVAEQLKRYVEAHPVQSALIALGIGFLLGALLSSRKEA